MKQKRNTVQKGIVFDVFREMHNHPSAGMVYEAVHEKYPEISKATVYRLLAEAAQEGEVLRLKLVDSDDRYDITLGKHYHIVCRGCGSVADVDATLNECEVLMGAKGYENFLVEDVHMEFMGICERCRQNIEDQK